MLIKRAVLTALAALFLILLLTASNMAAQFPKHYILSMPDSLKDHYNQLRKKYYYEYASNRKNGDLRYYTAMTLHDAGLLKWPECDYYNQKYGVMCNRISSEKLHDVLHYIYDNYPGSCAAEKIFNYVKAIVPYKGEKGDYPRFPLETLFYHGGDCEDSASAVAALLKMAGYTTALYTIHDYDHDIHHCVCVCKVPDNIDGDKWRIKEYYDWGYCWFMLDPAYHHSFGYNPSWVKHYLQSAGLISIPDKSANCLLIDFDAYKAFCEKMDK